jgi:hypothetical protein
MASFSEIGKLAMNRMPPMTVKANPTTSASAAKFDLVSPFIAHVLHLSYSDHTAYEGQGNLLLNMTTCGRLASVRQSEP